MKQESKFKYGLKNVSTFLQQFRREKLSCPNYSGDQINQKQETFDNCQIPNSKDSPSRIVIKTHQQINPYLKTKKHTTSLITQNLQQYELMHQPQKVGLADLVTKQHLQRTLNIYCSDLKQLEQNRQNLLEGIEELSLKIKSLNELQNKNQIMQLQNFKCKKQIISFVKQYHQLKLNLQKRKIKIQQNLQKKKDKIKNLLEIYPVQNQYVVQMQSWNFYSHELKQNKINSRQNPTDKKVNEQIFPKNSSTQQINNNKKQKSKTMIDKSDLLGDLKSFAKNFKMPSNNSNQV